MPNPQRTDFVLALSLDCRLTSEHLAALNPDQITALFEAVGTVRSLTETAERAVASERALELARSIRDNHPYSRCEQ